MELFIHKNAFENVLCEKAAIFPGRDELTDNKEGLWYEMLATG